MHEIGYNFYFHALLSTLIHTHSYKMAANFFLNYLTIFDCHLAVVVCVFALQVQSN